MHVSEPFILLFIFLCLSVLAIIGCMVRLVLYTKENSISGMIAQRYNPTSYVCIISIACFSILTSAIVIVGEVESPPGWTSSNGGSEWKVDPNCGSYMGRCSANVWLSAWSPIVCMCILFFPLVVHRSDRLLSMTPYRLNAQKTAALGPDGTIVTQHDIPNDFIQGVEVEETDGSTEAPSVTTSVGGSDVEMGRLSQKAAVDADKPSATDVAVDFNPIVVSHVGQTASSAVPPITKQDVKRKKLLPSDITNDITGLKLEKLSNGDWRILKDQTAQSEYTAWKAWEIYLWPVKYFPLSLYSYFHFSAVGVGTALGWAGLSVYLSLAWSSDEKGWTCCGHTNSRIPARVVVTMFLAVSVICAVIFTVMGHKRWAAWPRLRTLFEGICLLSVDLAIIFASLYGNALV